MDFEKNKPAENIAKKVLQRHYQRSLWLLAALVVFLGLLGKFESASGKGQPIPIVERIPASELAHENKR